MKNISQIQVSREENKTYETTTQKNWETTATPQSTVVVVQNPYWNTNMFIESNLVEHENQDKLFFWFHSQTIHVWYIYLRLA